MKKKPPTRPDLLERFAALGIGGKKFEADNGLPRNLIAKMRQGDYASEKAQATHRALEEAIERVEAERAPKTAKGAKEAPSSEPAKRAPGRPRAVEQLGADEISQRAALRDQILAASDIVAVDECNKRVAGALLDGLITDTSARVLKELLGERRQSLEDKAEQEERARAGQSLTIEVRYVNADWRNAAPEAPAEVGA